MLLCPVFLVILISKLHVTHSKHDIGSVPALVIIQGVFAAFIVISLLYGLVGSLFLECITMFCFVFLSVIALESNDTPGALF